MINHLPYMGAKPHDIKKLQRLVATEDPSLILEKKMDGVYMSWHPKAGFTLRSGKSVCVDILWDIWRELPAFTPSLTGELCLFIEGQGWQRREVTAGYLNHLMHDGEKKAGYKFHYFCWALWHSLKDTIEEARYSMQQLCKLWDFKFIHAVDSTVGIDYLMTEEEARAAIDKNNSDPMNPRIDGFMYKLGSQKFKEGKPSTVLKMKPPKTAYMRCVGIKPHTKKAGWIGSLELVLGCPTQLHLFVGSGMTDEDRSCTEYGSMDYLYKLIEIKYEDVTEPNKHGVRSLTLPRFVRVAPESTPATTLEEFLYGN